MYHPQHDREKQQPTHRPQQAHLISTALRVLTVVFWVGASICVAAIAMSSFTESIGAWLFLVIGVSLLVVVVSSGAIAWAEFRSNPEEDAERGEWTNKMLFYGLVFAITFFVTLLYLPALYFAP
jgi:ABC-type nickel/cobalt efflux system permease component RcnA